VSSVTCFYWKPKVVYNRLAPGNWTSREQTNSQTLGSGLEFPNGATLKMQQKCFNA